MSTGDVGKPRGPNSDSGKRAVRHNAVKHGLTARSAVVPGEDVHEYRDHMDAVDEYWSPVGPVEQFFVRQIADEMWQLERARRFEIHAVTSTIKSEQEAVRDTRNLSPCDFETTTSGIRELLALVTTAELELTENGTLSNLTLEQLELHCGHLPQFSTVLDGENPASEDISRTLTDYRAHLQNLAPKIKARERKISKAIKGINSIPSEGALNRLQRYETAIRRRLERDIRLLCQLQVRRMGREEEE